jgi:ubiquinone biosynthesis protein UbiJ
MLTRTALNFVNHVLTGETWARTRLQAFAGQTAQLSLGPLDLPICITSAGFFKNGDQAATPTVTIQLPADAPMRALTDRPSLFAAAHISGSAEFAEALGFVFRNLRWDVEDDLSQLVGDIAARRLLQGGKHFAQWHLQRVRNLALNVAEYLTEESATLARRADVAHFCIAVDTLSDDYARLEERVQKLQIR